MIQNFADVVFMASKSLNREVNYMDNAQLIELAKEARNFSYAPYSKFHVGACLLTKGGKTYTGCNIENSSYGATNCAERTAVFKAVSEGERTFTKIAILGENNDELTFPCGICLQVLWEFMPEGIVVLEGPDGIVEYQLRDLLPHGFILD